MTPPLFRRWHVHGQSASPCACGGRMLIRRCPIGHRLRLICAECGRRQPLALDTKLRLAGHPQLPGIADSEEV